MPRNSPVDINSLSSETLLTPGGADDIYVRVHNDIGCNQVTGIKTLVYLADPAALSAQWVPITRGSYISDAAHAAGLTVAAGAKGLIGPLPFTAPTTALGDGHKGLIAALQADGGPAVSNNFDAPNSNQVGQRNVQLSDCRYPLTNATSANGTVQLTLNVTPLTVVPSLTGATDIEVSFDDPTANWFSVWNGQAGNGTNFTVTNAGGITKVRLGSNALVLNAGPLLAGQSRTATGLINLPAGSDSATLAVQVTLFDASNKAVVTNGGSCVGNPTPVIP